MLSLNVNKTLQGVNQVVKQERQSKFLNSLEKWRNNKGIGTIVYPTGMGKSSVAALAMCLVLQKNPDAAIIVSYPRVGIDVNIKNAFLHYCSSFNLQGDDYNIKYYTAASLAITPLHTNCDLLIIDEIHEYYTQNRLKIYDKSTIKYKFLLCLTATPYDKDNEYKKYLQYAPIVDRVSEHEAIENGWMSKYLIFNLPVSLTDKERVAYDDATNTINTNLPKFNNDLDLITRCLVGGIDKNGKAYTSDDWCIMVAKRNGWNPTSNNKENSFWHPKMILAYAKHTMDAIRIRKTILYNAKNKKLACLELVRKFENLKTIIFNESTDMADSICITINNYYNNVNNDENTDLFNVYANEVCTVYHSNLKTVLKYDHVKNKSMKMGQKRLKDYAIDRIKSGKSRIISCVSALDAGFDVKDIKLAIITGLNTSKNRMTQRTGRAKRVIEEIETALVVNIYAKDTQDENWLKKSLEDYNEQVYWINSVDEINYEPDNIKKYIIDI